MASLDVLIVILYVTFAVYVVYLARQSFLAQKAANRAKAKAGLIMVSPDQEALDKVLDDQLTPLVLKDFLKLKLSSGISSDDKVDLLSLKAENRSTTYAVYINWKESWLTNSKNQSRSIARMTPNEGVSQTTSMIPPQQELKEAFTIMMADGPQPIPEAASLHSIRQQGKNKNPSSKVLLSLSIQLRSVSQFNKNHLIAVSCPISFSIPTDEELKEWREALEKKFAMFS